MTGIKLHLILGEAAVSAFSVFTDTLYKRNTNELNDLFFHVKASHELLLRSEMLPVHLQTPRCSPRNKS